jgi:hypothetical protein
MSDDAAVSLPQACRALGVTWREGFDLVLTGALASEQRRGRWYVSAESLEREQRRRKAAQGVARQAGTSAADEPSR